jgi:hypothetical protein
MTSEFSNICQENNHEHKNTHLENSKILFDIFILDKKHNIKIKENALLGKGTYGKVYYIWNIDGIQCVIKIIKNCNNDNSDSDNEYKSEIHFYKKYESSSFNKKSLPKLIDYGKAQNSIDSKIYDYIVLEYVGILSFNKILQNLIHMDDDERLLIKIIYQCIYIHLTSFHMSKMVFRDVTPSNIVVSDKITSFFMQKYFVFSNLIPYNMAKIVFKEMTIAEIIDDYKNKKYDEIVRFVDAGMFCDLDKLNNMEKYDKNDELFSGNFTDFSELDGMFSSTLRYVSPFCMLNLSSIIQNYDDSELLIFSKIIVEIALKLADIWSLNIMFLIHFYDITNPRENYEKIVLQKLKINRYNLSKFLPEDIFHNMPFKTSQNKLFIVRELFPYTNPNYLNNHQYLDLHNIVVNSLNNIIDLVNNIISMSKINKFQYILNGDKAIIPIVYNMISECEKNIKDNICGFIENYSK